jgi:hypothetical protein
MSAFYSLIPLKFLSGKAVLDYRKDISLIALVSTGAVFFCCIFKVLPVITYVALGVASAFMALVTLKKLSQAN